MLDTLIINLAIKLLVVGFLSPLFLFPLFIGHTACTEGRPGMGCITMILTIVVYFFFMITVINLTFIPSGEVQPPAMMRV